MPSNEQKYRQFPKYNSSTFDFSILQWCESNTYSAETVLQILYFVHETAIRGTIVSLDAEQKQWDNFTPLLAI